MLWELPLRRVRPGGAHVDHASDVTVDGGGEGVFSDVGAGVGGVDHDAGGDDETNSCRAICQVRQVRQVRPIPS